MTSPDAFPTAAHPLPIACTLPADRIPDQLGEWSALRAAATDTEPLDGGVRLALALEHESNARDLAEREQGCCSFLDIDVHIDGDRCLIDITSSHPDAGPIIAVLAGPTHPRPTHPR